MPSPTLPPRSLIALQSAPALRHPRAEKDKDKRVCHHLAFTAVALVANHELLHLLSCGGSADRH